MIPGRSDGVFNRSGVRFGSGEIYSVLAKFSSHVEDTICVGQRRPEDADERMLLFVKMRPGQGLSRTLVKEMKDTIRNDLSLRHVPDFIFEVGDIPYIINGKKVEVAVKQIVSGSNLTPSGAVAVANPEALWLYYQYAKMPPKVRGKL